MALIRPANFHLFVEILVRIGLFSAFCYMETMSPFVREIHQSELETELKYPRRESYVPGGLLWVVVLSVPCVLSLLAWAACNDCTDALEILLAWSLALGINGVLTDTVKLIAGRPRPDFFYRCFPDGVEMPDLQCTGDPAEIGEGRKSFPSGHSSLSWCSLGVASAWLCGRLGVLSRARGAGPRVLCCLAPLVAAACIALSRTCDYHHHWQGTAPPPALTNQLRLYHVDMNPYGHRALLILEAKRVQHEVYRLDPLRLPEWFRAKNPRLKIPVLEIPTPHGDRYLFESVVICDYLDEKYARNPLHATDPYVKAQDRLLIERFNELIKGSLECFDTNFAFGSEQIIQTLDIFEKELALRGTNYFGGNRPGMLDYMIWPWVERLYLLRCLNERKFDEKRSLFPNFADWGDQMQLDDVVKKHARSPAEYYEYYKNARAHTMGYYL